MGCNGDCFNCKYDDCVASQFEINFLDNEERVKNKELNKLKRYMTKTIDQKNELSEQELEYIKKSKEERKAEVHKLLWFYIKNHRAKHKTPNLFNLSEKN